MAGRTRTGGPTSGGGGGDGLGGADGGTGYPDRDQCNLHFTTPLQGADPAVVATLGQGSEVQPGNPFPRVICRVPATGEIAGSLAAADELVDLIACWSDGHRYRGQVAGAQRPPLIRVYRSKRPGG